MEDLRRFRDSVDRVLKLGAGPPEVPRPAARGAKNRRDWCPWDSIIDHPLVADYLRRLDAAAVVLPPGRRGELREEIRAHVADALATVGDDEASVRGVLDRAGESEDVVGAEARDAAPAPATEPDGPPAGPPVAG